MSNPETNYSLQEICIDYIYKLLFYVFIRYLSFCGLRYSSQGDVLEAFPQRY